MLCKTMKFWLKAPHSESSFKDTSQNKNPIVYAQPLEFYVCTPQSVIQNWLLLQTSADTVLDNESFDIRCYGWKNWSLHKVIYYKNDLAFKYFYESPTISIRNAKLNDSGTYHCTGYLRRLNYTSEKFRITVIKVYKSKYHWLQLIVPLLVVILFAVDTWLLVSTEKQFKLVLKIQKTGKHNKP
ncbi:Fc receptor IgE high affinity I alpha polypeptide [Cricetulus griseus]